MSKLCQAIYLFIIVFIVFFWSLFGSFYCDWNKKFDGDGEVLFVNEFVNI